ncbi:MAG: biosynthetic-type acetolactate synthase large subunit [Nitrososphaerota archaeon]
MKAINLLVKKMEEMGVDVIFGIPGGSNLPLYDALYDSDINSILMRHEQQAAHAADGYARVKKKPGIVTATSGPGATNLITGLVNAAMDSVPIVALTGQVIRPFMGTDAFQEADIVGLVLPHVKYATTVTDSMRLVKEFVNAYHCAISGRPGPTLLDIPRDVMQEDISEDNNIEIGPDEEFRRKAGKPSESELELAASLISSAHRITILVGGGVHFSGATNEVLRLAEIIGAPIVTTMPGKTCIPQDHPLAMGVVGMHGRLEADMAIINSDLVICVGTRLSDRAIGPPTEFQKNRKIIHIDIDASELGKNVSPTVKLNGDAKEILQNLISKLSTCKLPKNDAEWVEKLRELRRAYEEYIMSQADESRINSWKLIKLIREELPRSAIVTTGVGQHQMWAQLFFEVLEPGTFITSAGLGTMGFGLPAAFGAKVAAPDRLVVNIDGDGSFQMTCQTLSNIAEYNYPVITVIFDNRALGMVRQWQDLFYMKRFKDVDLTEITNFVKLSEAFGVEGVLAQSYDEVRKALRRAIRNDYAIVIDVPIDKNEKVFPMVPPGKWLAEFIGPPGFEAHGKISASVITK